MVERKLNKSDITEGVNSETGLVWFNISDPIPMNEESVARWNEGDIVGVYYDWDVSDMPTHYIVRRGQYHIVPEWDYMDVLVVNEDCTNWYSTQVARDIGDGTKISERRFHNLVAKLSDPNHDIMKIKKSYF